MFPLRSPNLNLGDRRKQYKVIKVIKAIMFNKTMYMNSVQCTINVFDVDMSV